MAACRVMNSCLREQVHSVQKQSGRAKYLPFASWLSGHWPLLLSGRHRHHHLFFARTHIHTPHSMATARVGTEAEASSQGPDEEKFESSAWRRLLKFSDLERDRSRILKYL
ncbi:hypothetical protein MHYP_G00151390 [Metynnis hypsauchen]